MKRKKWRWRVGGRIMVRWGIMGRSVGRMMGTKKANILYRYYYLFVFNIIKNEKKNVNRKWVNWLMIWHNRNFAKLNAMPPILNEWI